MSPQAKETCISLLKDQIPAIALMARHYRIPERVGGVIEGRTIGGTLPTLRLPLDNVHFRCVGS